MGLTIYVGISEHHDLKRNGRQMKVTLMMAVTADGMIARDHEHFPDWTCRADKQMFKAITQKAGVVVFGSKTFDTIGKPLSGRLNIVLTRHPERYQPLENLIFSSDPPERLLAELERRGFQEVILAGGAIVNTLFAKSRLIDEMILTIAPKLFGQGVHLLSEACDLDLKLLEARTIETDSLVLRYRVLYSEENAR